MQVPQGSTATAYFVPAVCVGVEYPWALWTSLVPTVVGIAAVSALLAQQNCFAVRDEVLRCGALGDAGRPPGRRAFGESLHRVAAPRNV